MSDTTDYKTKYLLLLEVIKSLGTNNTAYASSMRSFKRLADTELAKVEDVRIPLDHTMEVNLTLVEHGIIHSSNQELVDFAYRYAKDAHEGQVRKYTGEPYITHPVAVAKIVSGQTNDYEMICAALLHDTIEDCGVTYQDLIEDGFSAGISDLVLELSDVSVPSDGNRAVRKDIDCEHLAGVSSRAQTIKLADLIHNSESIIAHDKKFAVFYIAEKKQLLRVLTKGGAHLHEIATEIVEKYLESISLYDE